MVHKRVIERSKPRTAVLGAFLLLLLYLIVTSQTGLLHAFGHNHNVHITHTFIDENDPCHRLIYHNDVAAGCDLDIHLSLSDKCDLCDFAIDPEKILLTPAIYLTITFDSNFVSFYKSNLDSYWAVLSSSRAPPLAI